MDSGAGGRDRTQRHLLRLRILAGSQRDDHRRPCISTQRHGRRDRGQRRDLTTLHSNLTLTGLTPSELGSLTFLEAPPDVWFPQVQQVSVASELDIDNDLTWSSGNAVMEGPGADRHRARLNDRIRCAQRHFDGGEFINEGTATWETGQLDDELDNGTFFVNVGIFHANAQEFEPLSDGCRESGSKNINARSSKMTASSPRSSHIDAEGNLPRGHTSIGGSIS